MSKSTKTVVYFDWKMVIYIYVCEKKAHNLCYQWKSQSHSPAHVRMRLYHRLIARLSTKPKKDTMLEYNIHLLTFSNILRHQYYSGSTSM